MPDSEHLNRTKNINPDIYAEIYNRGVKSGMDHATPSPETTLRLNQLETDVKKLTEAFTVHSKEVIEHSERRDEHLIEMMEEFKEGMKEVKKITELLNNSSFAANLFLKIAIGLGAVVTFCIGTYLSVKQLH